jgi:hypothetical protein
MVSARRNVDLLIAKVHKKMAASPFGIRANSYLLGSIDWGRQSWRAASFVTQIEPALANLATWLQRFWDALQGEGSQLQFRVVGCLPVTTDEGWPTVV